MVHHGLQRANRFAKISPDGRYIALLGSQDDGPRALYRLEIDTGEATLLRADAPTEEGGSWAEAVIAWTPDGESILYTGLVPGESVLAVTLRSYRIATGEDIDVHTGSPLTRGSRIALSPDGGVLALTGEAHSIELVPISDSSELRTLDVPGVGIDPVGDLAWTPDSNHLIFVGTEPETDTPSLWKISVDGGRSQKLGLSTDHIESIRLHPDGERLIFNTGNTGGFELWAMHGFLPGE